MILFALVFSASVQADPSGNATEPSQAEQILIVELDRGSAFLSTQPVPPYYISLALQERQEVRVRAWADAIEKSEEIERRHIQRFHEIILF